MTLRTRGRTLACALLLATFAVPSVAADTANTGQWLTIVHDQRERSAVVRLPKSYDPSRPAPLLLVFHGGGGNAENAAAMSQMDALADQYGLIVVYPNGTGVLPKRLLTWNAWNCCGYAAEHQIDDVGYVRSLIDDLKRRYAVDARRVYATGLSNGGMMAHRLGCELSDQIAAIAPVAGALNTDSCQPRDPVSVVIFHGTADEHVVYEGGQNRKRFPGTPPRVDKSVGHAVSTWSKIEQCTPEAPVRRGEIEVTKCTNGRGGTEVVLYAIEGQGHAWPGGQPGLRNGNVDAPTQAISASRTMIEFFLQHPKL